jgi:putative ABC transport system permease protein
MKKYFYVIENALLNLGKNKGRNFLQGAMIFAVITTTVIALSIHNTSVILISEYKAHFGSEVSISPELMPSNLPGITTEQALAFSQSEYLRGFEVRGPGDGPEAADAVFYLKSPELLEAFAAEVRGKGLPDGYKVDIDRDAYARMVTPLEGLQGISFTFLLIVLALGAAIMVLLSVIAVRERKYEIGVLRAMGMKKNKLAMGIGVEIAAITCVCYLFGMMAGSLLSQPISDVLLAGQQSAGFMNAVAAQPLASVKITASPLTALEIFGVAIVLASIAGIVSARQVAKYEPIKILMERN